MKRFFIILVLCFLVYVVHNCSRKYSNQHTNVTTFCVEDIQLDSVSHVQNPVEKNIGIPAPIHNVYHYNVTLTDKNGDTTQAVIVKYNRGDDMKKWIGDSIKVKGYVTKII